MVTCMECGREYKRLNVFHLRLHGLNEGSYLEKHPGAELFSVETLALISEKTKIGMHAPEAWQKFEDHIASRDNSQMATHFKSDRPETKVKMYSAERNKKISQKRKSWWDDGRVGKTVEEIFGEETGAKMRASKSERMKGEKNPAYGKVYENCGGRKIGRYKGHLFRSLYEYSYYKLLESRGLDLDCDIVYEPVTLSYVVRGKRRNYFPDFLVKPDSLLIEIKSTHELNKKKGKLIRAAKFAAGEKYAAQNSLSFQVLTEKDFKILSTATAKQDPHVEWIRNR